MARWLLLLVLFQTVGLILSQKCTTTSDSKDPNQRCIFPFIYKGVTYHGCPIDLVENNRRWCSTETDLRGNHVSGKDKYGFCSNGCPEHESDTAKIVKQGGQKTIIIKKDAWAGCKTVGGPAGAGVPCQIPFIFKGQQYYGCPIDLVDKSKTWCSTKLDSQGNHISGENAYGFCANDCPKHVEEQAPKDAPTSCPGSAEECRPPIICAAQFPAAELENKVCAQSDGSVGICCKDVTTLPPDQILSTEAELGLRGGGDFSGISSSVTTRAAELGLSFANNVTTFKARSIGSTSSATFRHFQNGRQSPGADRFGRAAIALAQSAQELVSSMKDLDVRTVNFANADLDNTVLENACEPQPTCNPNSKYRTIDGSCNNLREPNYGKSFTPLQRILGNAYADGLTLPRVNSRGQRLPSTRLVSTTARFNTVNEDPNFTALLVAFGQFLDHDLDHVPLSMSNGEPIDCCDEEGNFVDPNTLTREERFLCIPIEIPSNDRTLRQRCISLVRSVTAPRLDCQPGPLEQMSQITHWLDSSNVYGSLDNVATSLRSFQDGLLRTVVGDDGQEQLPIDPNTNCRGPSGRCGLAGDLRANEQPTLGAMHVLFLREHNRLARALKVINPSWGDERLYLEARRILNAQWQHIIYNEWLPIVLGSQFLETFGLQPLTKGFSTSYRNDFDPRVTNEFAAAAFRIGHTLIPSVIRTFSTATRKAKDVLDLQDTFSDADILRKTNAADEIIKGLTIQPTESYDNNFSEDVTDHLFDDGDFGLDLIAINMQRARDHGIPGYIEYRSVCGLGRAQSFDDLSSNIPKERIELLKKAYDNVADIDLFIGMTQEIPTEKDAFIGSTFLCLIGDVFARMRFGDRFFYDLKGQAGSFTEDQLNQIRRTSMARLICDNTNVDEIQPLAFRQVNGKTNPLTRCTSRLFLKGIPSVDLSVFKE